MKNASTLFTLSLFFCLLLTFFSEPAQSQSENGQVSYYKIYSGGFHFLDAKMGYQERADGNNHIRFQAHPRGFIGSLLPWYADIEAVGVLEDNQRYQPVFYKSLSEWRGRPKIRELRYDEEGRLIQYSKKDDDKPERVIEYDETLARDAVNVAGVFVKILTKDMACGRDYTVFDGKRRFNIELGQPNTVSMKPSRYNIYQGQAHKCTVNIERIAGFDEDKEGWEKTQEHSVENHVIPTIWIGQREDKPFKEIVRLQVKTDYGTTIMHLSAENSFSEEE